MTRFPRWTVMSFALALTLLGIGSREGSQASPKPTRFDRLEEKLKEDPNNAQTHSRLGVAYYYAARNGKVPLIHKAIDRLERARELEPEDLWIREQLGAAYLLQSVVLLEKGPEKAKEAVDRAQSIFDALASEKPEESSVLAGHGLSLILAAGVLGKRELYPKAMAQLDRAVEVDPFEVDARLARGFTLMATPTQYFRDQTVVEDLSALLDILASGQNEKARGVIQVLLGDAWLRLKDSEKAQVEYDRALQIDSPAKSIAEDRITMLRSDRTDWKKVLSYDAIGSQCTMCHGSANAEWTPMR